MHLTKSKAWSRLLYAALACACGAVVAAAQTAVIADCENGTNQNNFGAYWYVYADAADGGNTDITNATPNGDGTYEFTVTAGEGNPGGTPGYGAKMDYKLGETDPGSGTVKWGSMAGIGTMLALEGKVCNVTGATTITYWAKANPPVDIRVEVATSAVADFCYHHTIHSIGASWEKQTITLSEPLGIQQYSWGKVVAFDPTTVEKVQWAISEDEGATENSSGSLWIDDVEIQPFTYIPPDACASCVADPGTVPNNYMLADMEETRNGLGYYSYCYNDVGTRTVSGPSDYSEIYEGVNSEDPQIPVMIIDGKHGYDNTEGAYIGFELGPTYKENAMTILPFVGIGTNLADDLGLEPFNASAANATGVYFMYKTTGDYDYVNMEVNSDQTFGNAGAVYYIKVPATGGEWKAATVPFSKLVLPAWDDVTPSPLDTKKLTKIQWKVQAAAGTKGTLAIDNVVLLGAAPNWDPMSGVRHALAARGMKAFSLAQDETNIVLAINDMSLLAGGRAQLRTMQGKVVATQHISASQRKMTIPLATLCNGVYLLTLSKGQTVLRTSLSVIR